MDDVREGELTRPDGRVVAWTECGDRSGRPVLRIPGTPGSRWPLRSDLTPWNERNLWMITTERPGFGHSTRLRGRGFSAHADDLAAILDELTVDSAHVLGVSGGAPYVLALSSRHASRVRAATVVSGAAPLQADEFDLMIPHNAQTTRQAATGDRAGLESALRPVRDAIVADPVGTIASLMESSPRADRLILTDPALQAALARGLREALVQGVDGWVDEVIAEAKPWTDIDLSVIQTSITWYHAPGDDLCPISAVKRLLAQIPTARLVEWPEDVGHLQWFRAELEILDELIGRGADTPTAGADGG